MKLIPLRQAQVLWMNAPKNKKLESLSLYTFKKDRFVKLEKRDGTLLLSEKGYVNQETALGGKDDKKLLKEAFAREFPRSTRIYVQQTEL